MKGNEGKGCLIAFEGIDGSGKTTQINLLRQRLIMMDENFYITNEPTDSPIGSVIHQIMTGRIVSDNKVVAALFAADRLDHLLNPVDGIYEKVQNGVTVIMDRYYFSSYAYHGVDMPMDWVISANSPSADLLRPTVTVFLDVEPEEAIRRIGRNRSRSELFEKVERLYAVREKYFEAFEKLKNEEKIIIVEGTGDVQIVEKRLWTQLQGFFHHNNFY